MHDIDYWREKLPEFTAKLDEMLVWPLPFVINPRFEDFEQEALDEAQHVDTMRSAIKKATYGIIDSSRLPLSLLMGQVKNKVQDFLPSLMVDSNEILDIIHEIAHRKFLGVSVRKKNIYEDTNPACLWYWELDDFPQPRAVKDERAKIGKMVKALTKLIGEISKETPNIENIAGFHHDFNNLSKKYSAIKENQNLPKKSLLLEKKKKTEEETPKKEEKKAPKKEEKKTPKKEEKKIPKKEEKKTGEADSITKYFQTAPIKQNVQVEQVAITPQATEALPGDPQTWLEQWRMHKNFKDPTRIKYIYIHDSALKPYYVGRPKDEQPSRNPEHLYESINYEQDSEEEYEELHGEDVNAEDESDDDMSVDNEEENTFIVPDDYCSEDEDSGVPCFNINFIEKPMKIYIPGDPFLDDFSAFRVNGGSFPVSINYQTASSTPKTKVIDDYMDTLIEVAKTRVNIVDIINAFLEKCPNISKASIKRKLQEQFVKVTKSTEKGYILKESNPNP